MHNNETSSRKCVGKGRLSTINKMGDSLIIWVPKSQQSRLTKLRGKTLIATLETLDDDNGDSNKK